MERKEHTFLTEKCLALRAGYLEERKHLAGGFGGRGCPPCDVGR